MSNSTDTLTLSCASDSRDMAYVGRGESSISLLTRGGKQRNAGQSILDRVYLDRKKARELATFIADFLGEDVMQTPEPESWQPVEGWALMVTPSGTRLPRYAKDGRVYESREYAEREDMGGAIIAYLTANGYSWEPMSADTLAHPDE